MTQGEPLEENRNARIDDADAPLPEPALSAPDEEYQTSPARTDAGTDKDLDTLDADVQNLLNALSSEEYERDAEWVEASREDTIADAPTAVHAIDEVPLADDPPFDELPQEAEEVLDKEPATDGVVDDRPSQELFTPAAQEQAPLPPAADVQPQPVIGLDVINALGDKLGEKIEASNARNTESISKMGHAIGVIAKRIDTIETRMTDRTIDDVAMAAAPPEEDEDDDDDPNVAPYIARAEKELKKKKSSTDIFDRIAKAAETEFDEKPADVETRVLKNSSDGRRVGTKRWQPSKTVKRRMQQLEEAKAATTGTTPVREAEPLTHGTPQQEPVSVPQADEAIAAPLTAPPPVHHTDMADDIAMTSAPEPIVDMDDEEDDSGLSIVPGARGRRRNRARKSRMDADFENVFAEEEEGGKPSISSLRRKMREKPEEQEEAAPAKGGLLGGILGRKSSKNDIEDDGVSDALSDMPENDAPKTAKATAKRQSQEIDDEDDEDWSDDEYGAASSSRRPLLYVLIAATAAAGFFAFQTFMS